MSEYYITRLIKGARVYISGRVENRQYKDMYGNTKYFYEIVLSEIILLDKNCNSENNLDSSMSQKTSANSIDNVKTDLPF